MTLTSSTTCAQALVAVSSSMVASAFCSVLTSLLLPAAVAAEISSLVDGGFTLSLPCMKLTLLTISPSGEGESRLDDQVVLIWMLSTAAEVAFGSPPSNPPFFHNDASCFSMSFRFMEMFCVSHWHRYLNICEGFRSQLKSGNGIFISLMG